MTRNFEEWISKFRRSIADYGYYVDFKKVVSHVDQIKVELNILNSLVGSKNIENDFELLVVKYPECLKCIPILLAVRETEIAAMDEDGQIIYNFSEKNCSVEQYKNFMKKTGLFDMIQNHIINNLVDYVFGVETGLDSNGRKNRGGHLMENLVELFLKMNGIKYYKEMYLSEIEEKWGLNLSALSNNGESTKRFDFVVKTESCVYAIETNFYTSSGSKLNETARSYKMLAEESKGIDGFKFVWFTDGIGWNAARNNLKETFDVMEHLYSIEDIEDGIMRKIFV